MKINLDRGQMQAARALVALCNESLLKHEYNTRKIKGVALSHSDVETAKLYAETIICTGYYTGVLMPPRCEVAALLKKFGLLEE